MSDNLRTVATGHAHSARGLFVDGEHRPSADSRSMEIRSPGTGKLIGSVTLCSIDDVDLAVRSSHKAFLAKDWAGMSVRTRARLVNKLADVLENNLDELFELETLNNGRPVRETRAQLSRIPDLFRYNAGLALARRDSVIPVEGDYLTYTKRVPVGVVANVTPFNHPLLIASRNIAPALASGCTTVVKPSEYTPLTTLRLAELFIEAGLPPGAFNVVTGDGATTGKALTNHQMIRKLVLTGGTEAGRLAGAAAASNFARQTLELGGKTPVVVFDDFNVDQAVNYAAFGAFVGAGQTCVCAARHIVQRAIYREFVDKLAEKAKAIKVGDPFDPATQMGPVISERQRSRVLEYVRIGNAEGARLVAGGAVPTDLPSDQGFFVQPTVFADVTPAMRIAQEEVFGPFTVVIPFDTEEHAIAIANDSPYGLAAAIRTRDVARAHRVAERIEAGIVWVNDHHRVDAASPWGGFKLSGTGREFGQESFDAYFDVKATMVNVGDQPFDWFDMSARNVRLN
ncbi:aldehyde dehydrogenase [Rhizobium sp. S152]|uniref:aldehyde dehydrogenase n=1 Tax=Rhizobium sp. S152 TaxID=3055038 RepID=UPI0025A95C96|nr:aldehyde dehydrogenase [Rhizobium sp. S152]MDM9627527.1 aldehyde dehydrogenase [Rhizobium sp. S152]